MLHGLSPLSCAQSCLLSWTPNVGKSAFFLHLGAFHLHQKGHTTVLQEGFITSFCVFTLQQGSLNKGKKASAYW
jgi:hypothetical protein